MRSALERSGRMIFRRRTSCGGQAMSVTRGMAASTAGVCICCNECLEEAYP